MSVSVQLFLLKTSDKVELQIQHTQLVIQYSAKSGKLTNRNTVHDFANLFFFLMQIDTKLKLSISVCFYKKTNIISNVFS